MTLLCFPRSTENLRALERARVDLVSAIVYSGVWPRANSQTPIKLLRAFFGPRWVSREIIDMDDCMIEEATEFLHRMALEMRMEGRAPVAPTSEFRSDIHDGLVEVPMLLSAGPEVGVNELPASGR